VPLADGMPEQRQVEVDAGVVTLDRPELSAGRSARYGTVDVSRGGPPRSRTAIDPEIASLRIGSSPRGVWAAKCAIEAAAITTAQQPTR
jgi:hypothetical protein